LVDVLETERTPDNPPAQPLVHATDRRARSFCTSRQVSQIDSVAAAECIAAAR
jgi:hypothetical protein